MTDQLTRILATLKEGETAYELPEADKQALNEWLTRKIDPENKQRWFTKVCYGNNRPREGRRDYTGPDFTARENAMLLVDYLEGDYTITFHEGVITVSDYLGDNALFQSRDNTALILAAREVGVESVREQTMRELPPEDNPDMYKLYGTTPPGAQKEMEK